LRKEGIKEKKGLVREPQNRNRRGSITGAASRGAKRYQLKSSGTRPLGKDKAFRKSGRRSPKRDQIPDGSFRTEGGNLYGDIIKVPGEGERERRFNRQVKLRGKKC